MSLRLKQWSAVALTAFAALSAQAAEIAVSSVTASSTFYTYNVNNLINGSGLAGDLHDGNWTNKWLLNGETTGTLTFDLGSLFKIESTKIWNYGPGCCGVERSVKDLTIGVSTDGINFVNQGSFVLAEPGTNPFPGESIALGNVSARFVRFSLDSNYGEPSYTGLSEVKFYGASAVPEPEAMGLALVGLGVAGIALRRRQAKAA